MLIADLSQLWLLLDENGKKNNILRIIQQSLTKEKTHHGEICFGRTPIKTFVDAKPIWKSKADLLNVGVDGQSMGV